ncbi:MAG TPA: branched-chain amino acid ABC transporter permease [Candidatus Dormibacteraeota bacterium]
MRQLSQQVVSGLASGGIFASLALAFVLVYRAMGVVNFAQGEIAMFTTFIAWSLLETGMPYLAAFLLAVVAAFAIGVGVERTVIRPVERGPVLATVIVTIGLATVFNGLAGAIWLYMLKAFPSPFSARTVTVDGVAISYQDLGLIGASLVVMVLMYGFFQRTRLGLVMRAAALDPVTSRLLGVRVGWMLALGWGLAAMVGAVSGMMVAPVVFLEPNFMQTVAVYALAAAVLGGIDSALGAVVGGAIVGVTVNLAGTYLGSIGASLRLVVALAIIVGVLVVRPSGLLGRPDAQRV